MTDGEARAVTAAIVGEPARQHTTPLVRELLIAAATPTVRKFERALVAARLDTHPTDH